MVKNENRNYKEISLERKEYDEKHLIKTYQYEYALYETVAGLFEAVDCRSYIEPLRLHFAELPDAVRNTPSETGSDRKKRKTKTDFLEEVSALVEKDVIGNICFPMMHLCRAQMSVIPENDGTHTFHFTDGIYGFSVHISVPAKGNPKGIDVTGSPRKISRLEKTKSSGKVPA